MYSVSTKYLKQFLYSPTFLPKKQKSLLFQHVLVFGTLNVVVALGYSKVEWTANIQCLNNLVFVFVEAHYIVALTLFGTTSMSTCTVGTTFTY